MDMFIDLLGLAIAGGLAAGVYAVTLHFAFGLWVIQDTILNTGYFHPGVVRHSWPTKIGVAVVPAVWGYLYIGDGVGQDPWLEQLGFAVGCLLVAPHIVCVVSFTVVLGGLLLLVVLVPPVLLGGALVRLVLRLARRVRPA